MLDCKKLLLKQMVIWKKQLLGLEKRNFLKLLKSKQELLLKD